jgi:NAD(P)H-dependent flavin oxidoreductase YrpB (nitropropane dioxygenase family)
MFGIKHPVLLAGMNVAAGPKLAAAVSNAGGLGVIGGVGYTPDMLKDQIAELKEHLTDKNAPFGVDLLLPQVGGNARKTKYVFPPTAQSCQTAADVAAPATTTQRASSASWSTLSSSPVPRSSSPPSVSPPRPLSTSCTPLVSST